MHLPILFLLLPGGKAYRWQLEMHQCMFKNQQMSVSLSLVGWSVFISVATVREQPDLHIVIEDRLSSRFTSNRDNKENKKDKHE